MKSIIKLIVAVSLIVLLAACAPGTLSSSWEKVLSLKTVPQVAGDETLAGTHFVTFLDGTTAVAVNFLNQLYTSADGGVTWKKTIVPSNLSCQHPEAVDERTILVGGPRSVVSLSADGGETWRRIEETGQLFILSVTDSAGGFFANYNKLAAWSGHPDYVRELPLPSDLGKGIMAVAALPEQAVYILSQNGRLLYSGDLGKSWVERKLPIQPERELVFEYLVSTMRFRDKDEGMIFTFDKKQNQWIALASHDGGESWMLEPVLQGNEGRSAIGPDAAYVTIMPARSEESIIVLMRQGK